MPLGRALKVSEQMDEVTDRVPAQGTSGGLLHFLSRLRSYLIWFYTVVLGTVSLVCSFFDRDGELQHKVARLWARVILLTLGIKVTLKGFDRIDTEKAYVYVVNHLSSLDIPVLYACLPFHFRILDRKSTRLNSSH